MKRWVIMTGEYPPAVGGVSDYSQLVAEGLAVAGDGVDVLAPPLGPTKQRMVTSSCSRTSTNVRCHVLPDHYGPRSLIALEKILHRLQPDCLLLQYTPHAYGFKAMNLPLALWLYQRARQFAPLWVMFHEVAFPFSWRPVKHAVLASTNRLMARLIASAAQRIFVAIPAWEKLLQQCCPRLPPIEWLPVPATVPALSEETREEMFTSGAARPNGGVIGHFGTYSPFITPLLVETIYRIAIRRCDTRFLLLGRGALNFREQLLTRFPELRGRVEAKEGLSAVSIAGWLRRCDVLLQPYLDGISSRRTTVMAGLANGRAIVTNLGPLSEPLWSEGAVVAVARPDPQALAEQVIALLNDPASRAELAGRAAALYQSRFSLTHTLTRLRTLLCGAPDGC